MNEKPCTLITEEGPLFNNKEILVGKNPIFIKEWYNKNNLFLQDLLNSNGQVMFNQEFENKIRLQNEPRPILSSKCNIEVFSHKSEKHYSTRTTLKQSPFSN